ncbi:fibronectin type III-like domain-containing protein [Hirsutella rhossiliensis]|uniref:beta-glucosidase n=1 Tax=Hirsutella rhossiliensis TaxID=111463 RepID=A0A9P8N8F8_9HYPO|nr:fibronectin type III-like domain-containing protein [Hirsutella rhossiliensis]KAH0967634.1 fibronectin type III-like domain-containing protein [Hirsutella rhossiliensis]
MLSPSRALLSGLAGLAVLKHATVLAAASSNQNRDGFITDDAYFYGQSPPIYPSPPMTGGDWAHAHNMAVDLVSKMTLKEKVGLTGGVDLGTGCSGSIAPIERLGFPGMCLSDAGNGLRGTDLVNAYPSGIHVGASWNKHLARRRGAAMAAEFRRKGVNVLLGPVVSPAWRVVRGGRNWEGFSVDPYLSGLLVSESVRGIQAQGVQASVKHFIANEQETYRTPSASGADEAISSNIDDKTMHEMYLWPFQDAVKAGAGNIMCSYQRINNSYGCANSKTLNGLLKTELGFQGFVVTDWGAQHAGVATALAGLDMAMPSGDQFWGHNLIKAVKNGTVPESRVDDMVTRIMTTWYQFKQDTIFTKPGFGMPKDLTKPHEAVEGRAASALPVLLVGAIEGHVLVKNTKKTLPLKRPRMLSLFGYSAKSPDAYAPGSGLLASASWASGAESIDVFELGQTLINSRPSPDYSTIGKKGTLYGGCGSGATTPAVFTSPFESLKVKAAHKDTAIYYDFESAEPAVDPLSDACIVFGNAWACEGYDRPAIHDEYTDNLIRTVANQCAKTIVVFHNAGPRLVDSGEAFVSLLYGDSNPSGKLSYTVAKNDTDYGHLLNPDLPHGKYKKFPQSDFSEGTYLDYKYFDKHGIEPRYEFGFGLSYTTFAFSDLAIRFPGVANRGPHPVGAVAAGGPTDLWDVMAVVSVSVENTGARAGAEVAQLYVGIPGEPARQLRGFEKTYLKSGERQVVSFELTRRDLSVWDTTAQKWRLQKGTHRIHVGNSSRNLPLTTTLSI